jgi:hypothetical protein
MTTGCTASRVANPHGVRSHIRRRRFASWRDAKSGAIGRNALVTDAEPLLLLATAATPVSRRAPL